MTKSAFVLGFFLLCFAGICFAQNTGTWTNYTEQYTGRRMKCFLPYGSMNCVNPQPLPPEEDPMYNTAYQPVAPQPAPPVSQPVPQPVQQTVNVKQVVRSSPILVQVESRYRYGDYGNNNYCGPYGTWGEWGVYNDPNCRSGGYERYHPRRTYHSYPRRVYITIRVPTPVRNYHPRRRARIEHHCPF